jgi:hypothetical protein
LNRLRSLRPRAVFRWARSSRRNLIITLGALLVVLMLFLAAVSSLSQRGYEDLEFIGFDVDRVLAVETQLTSWPTRHTGTIYEGQAAEFIRGQFEDAGLDNVHIEEFEEVLYEVRGASLQLVYYMTGPLGLVPNPTRNPVTFEHKVDFVVQGFSGSRSQGTGPRTFLNDLDYVSVQGNGSDTSDYAGAAGSAAIIESSAEVSNYRIFDVAYEAGVEALIIHNVHWGERIGYVPISKGSRQPDGWPDPSYPDIPFLMLSKDAGDTIIGASNAKLRMNVDVDIGYRTVHVVVGEVVGKEKPEEFVVIGSHHDCVYVGVGAIDNGSGTTTVVELAHQLSETEPARTIRFLTYGAEEDGLMGSFDYVDAHAEEIEDNCVAVLNFDMPHVNLDRDNRGFVTPDDEDRFGVFEAIIDQIYEERPDLDETFNYSVSLMSNPTSVGSDSMPFARLGVPTTNFWGAGAWEYHTYLEDMSHFVPEGLEMAVLIGGSYALWVANGG